MSVPLTGATWTQGANETDWISGTITFTEDCSGPIGSTATIMDGDVSLDGRVISTNGDQPVAYNNGFAYASGDASSAGVATPEALEFGLAGTNQPQTSPIAVVNEPTSGTPRAHTLTAHFETYGDNCTTGGLWTITNVALDVTAAK
jgi:hypothetical protein